MFFFFFAESDYKSQTKFEVDVISWWDTKTYSVSISWIAINVIQPQIGFPVQKPGGQPPGFI